MKLLLVVFGLCFSMSSFAKFGEINMQNLNGHWSCSASFKVGDLDVIEVSKLSFQEDGSSLQVGVGYYKNMNDEAKLQYNIASSWSLNNKVLTFYKSKINHHSFDNAAFNKKYQITENLIKNVEKDHEFIVDELTENLLVIIPKGYNFAEVCHKL